MTGSRSADAAPGAGVSRRGLLLRVAAILGAGAALACAELRSGRPAPLPAATIDTLLAAAASLLGGTRVRDHYRRYLQVRAQASGDLHARYCAAAAELDGLSRGRGGVAFVDAPRAVRDEFVSAARHPAVRRFRDDVLWCFRKSEAFLRLGYRSWPGQPRGLDEYRSDLPRG
jgi:hypothetical protein